MLKNTLVGLITVLSLGLSINSRAAGAAADLTVYTTTPEGIVQTVRLPADGNLENLIPVLQQNGYEVDPVSSSTDPSTPLSSYAKDTPLKISPETPIDTKDADGRVTVHFAEVVDGTILAGSAFSWQLSPDMTLTQLSTMLVMESAAHALLNGQVPPIFADGKGNHPLLLETLHEPLATFGLKGQVPLTHADGKGKYPLRLEDHAAIATFPVLRPLTEYYQGIPENPFLLKRESNKGPENFQYPRVLGMFHYTPKEPSAAVTAPSRGAAGSAAPSAAPPSAECSYPEDISGQ